MPTATSRTLHGVGWQQHLAGLTVAYLRTRGGTATRVDVERRLAEYGASAEDCADTLFGGVCAGVLAVTSRRGVVHYELTGESCDA